MRYYFLEDYNDGIDIRSANIVALTPQVAFSLDKENRSYYILDDFYSENELRKEEDNFFLRQLLWMDNLDAIIKDHVELFKDNNIAITKGFYYLSFKYVIDTVIIEAYILKRFIEKEQPKEICYFYNSRKRKNPVDLFDWMDDGSNFYIELLSILAIKNNFSFTAIDIAEKTLGHSCALEKKSNLKKTYSFIKRLSKAVFLSFKYNKYAFAFRRKKHNSDGANIIFLHSACQPLDFLIKDFLFKGANIFVREEGNIYFENHILRKMVLKDDSHKNNKHLFDKAKFQMKTVFTKLCTKGRLLDWVSKESGLDVSSILTPFMEYFFQNIVARSIVEAEILISFYRKTNIDFVLARAGTDRSPIAGLLASKCVKDVKSVCFQHGCYAFDAKALHITETGMFDIYFATDDLSAKYFKEAAPPYINNNCLVLQEPYIFQRIEKIKKKNKLDTAGEILYIPVNHSYFLRCFNNMDYSAVWYYKFQKELVDFFATKKDFTFIYKQPPGHKWCTDSIVAYINDSGYKNIKIGNGSVPDNLSCAEKVIIDSMSTPFFEAAAFGMPTLAMVRDYLPTWKPAFDYFRNNIQVFSDDRKIFSKIESFLYEDSKYYFIDLPMTVGDTYAKLVTLRGNR